MSVIAHRGPAIAFQNLTLGYDRHPAVHHIDGMIGQGDMLALVGPNGAGKSTLLRGIIGELKPLDGSIKVNGGSRDIAYLPQQFDIDRNFPVSVFDCVAMGLWREIGAFRGLSETQKLKVGEALAALGLQGLEKRAVGALSGGQFQRVLFARLLLQDASLILLDEPFRAVDATTVADLIQLIERWHKEGRTIIAALHDMEQVRKSFPHTLMLAREVIAWGDTVKVLSPQNFAKAKSFAQSFDDHAAICAREEEAEKERQRA